MDLIKVKYFLEYKGPAVEREIDAGKLGNALIGLEDGIKKICSKKKELENVEIKVIANKGGSFIVDILVGIAVTATGTLIANFLNGKLRAFTEQFRIKKFIRRKNYKAIPQFGDKDKQVKLINEKREEIYVSSDAYEIYQSKIVDKDIYKIVEALEEEKVIKLKAGIPDTEFIESVDISDKPYFVYIEDQELPELEDQKEVDLDGEIISFNKRRKLLGFVYKDRIIYCHPAPGKNVIDFIEFARSTNVKLHGTVYRPDKNKSPNIYIKKIDYIQPPFNY